MSVSRTHEISEREALKLFKGWFHNKMNIILIMSQYPHLRRKGNNTHNQLAFLHDLEHHFVGEQFEKKIFFNVIRWLKAFFHIAPERITPKRSRAALKKIETIFDAFGFPFHWNHGQAKIEEMLSVKNGSGRKDYNRVLERALSETRKLLSQSEVREDDIHNVKSVLYAALERLGMIAERFFSMQRMLRELFSIVTSSYDFKNYEREVGLQILDDIEKRYL